MEWEADSRDDHGMEKHKMMETRALLLPFPCWAGEEQGADAGREEELVVNRNWWEAG